MFHPFSSGLVGFFPAAAVLSETLAETLFAMAKNDAETAWVVTEGLDNVVIVAFVDAVEGWFLKGVPITVAAFSGEGSLCVLFTGALFFVPSMVGVSEGLVRFG